MSQILITPSNTSGATQAALRSKPRGENDRIPQEVIDELLRRFYVLITGAEDSNFVISTTAPTDKTKVWIQSDASGIPNGRPKVWDAGSGAWKPLIPEAEPQAMPKQKSGTFFTPAGASVKTVNFASMGGTNYRVSLIPTLYDGSSWATPPSVFPDKYGYFIANKSDTLFTIQFYGIPTGGLTWEWDIEERRSE